MSQLRGRRSRLPPVASILMILLGLFTINFVSVYAGALLVILGVVMYLVHRRLTKTRDVRSEDSSTPPDVPQE